MYAADLNAQPDNQRWGNGADKIRVGSSGSSLLTRSGLSIGVLSALESYSLLENSWTLSHSSVVPDLSQYLDPGNTWISSVPRGYLKELISNPSDNDYNVEVSSDHSTSQTIPLYSSGFFSFWEYPITATTSSIILGEGILPAESNSGEVIMYVTPASHPGNLLYGVTYDDDMSHLTTKFKGNAWHNDNTNPFNLPDFPVYTNENFNSKDIKNSILTHIRNVSEEQGEVIELRNFNFDATIHLRARTGTASVRAIKLPNMMPFNAVELFDKERLNSMWRSYHYKPGRGGNSDEYYIQVVEVELEQYVPLPDQEECVLLPKKTLREITTKNNGGYLNLKNPHYQIKNIVASHEDCPKNRLFVTIETKDSELLTENHYGAWLDYHKDRKESGNQNPKDNYTYNFVHDNTRHPEEQLGVSSNIGSSRTIEHEIPYNEDLSFDSNGKITTSLRVAIAEQPQPGQTVLTQDGIYERGEVEDYLAEIRPTSEEDEREAVRVPYASVILVEEGDYVDAVAEAVDVVPPGEELPILTAVAVSVPFDYDRHNIGTNSIIFDAQTYINVAEGADLVHDPASKKTFSIDFLMPSIDDTSDELLFEEGGGENGFSLRIKDRKIKFGVKIDDQLAVIETSSALSIDRMINTTAVFNEGKLELYLNGVLEASDDQSFPSGTSLPEHLDDAGIGGIVGTSIWDDGGSISYFDGLIDYFEYWNDALTTSAIGILATRVTSANSGARIATTPSEKGTVAPKEESETAPYFSIFPNPSRDVLNILVEIQRAGTLNIAILDLKGRKVYETGRPNISPGHQLITLSNLNIAPGEYMINIHAGNVKKSTRIIFE